MRPAMPPAALAVLKDLMFKSRIIAAAQAAGVKLDTAGDAATAVARAKAHPPDLVILDLNLPEAFETAAALLEVAPTARYVGFYAHVQAALKRQAQAEGIEAMPHSQFVEALPGLLKAG